MYRDDRDALAGEVEDLRRELTEARGQNQAMRQALLAQGRTASISKTIYQPGGSLRIAEGERIAFSEHRLEGASPWLIGILHLLTFGVSSMIHFSLKHDKLPKVADDDPSGGRALGFMFIPYFNWYWIFQNALRLADRLNFQLELRGEAPLVNRNLVIAACVCQVIPYVGWFIVGPIVWLFAALSYQNAINRLAALGPGLQGQRALPPGGWGGGSGHGWQHQQQLPAPQGWGAPQGYPPPGHAGQAHAGQAHAGQAHAGQAPQPGWGQAGTPGAPGTDPRS